MKDQIRTVRASYDDDSIIVYQAYNSLIAKSAVENQTFVSPPFKKDRMTWIKPSFFWMMYRSGWGTKENQERILSIRMTRQGFEWALRHSCLSHFDPEVYLTRESWEYRKSISPVRVQWDPERDQNLRELPTRAIQIGLSGEAIDLYLSKWIVQIQDVTEMSRQIKAYVDNALAPMPSPPEERDYVVSEEIRKTIGLV